MRAYAIGESEVKGFMNRLLREALFDGYEVRGVEISAMTRVDISGETEADETRRFCLWSELRPLVRLIIQQGEKPRAVKIVFSCGAEVCAAVHENASALFLNLLYENGGVTFTAATAQKQFALDKSLDAAWDDYVSRFFKDHGVNAAVLT